MERKRKFNINLLGESCVGKTCLINTYRKYEFHFNTVATFGFDLCIIKKTFDKLLYTFKIFDNGGSIRFANWTIQVGNGYFLIFAVNNRQSFEKAIKWIDYIGEYINLEEKVFYLIGNKIDEEEREVTKEEAEEFARKNNFKYFETSALTKEGVNEAFEEMFNDVYLKSKMNNETETNNNFKIYKIKNKKKANYLSEIFKKKSTKKINNYYEKDETDNQNNKEKCN